MFLFLIIKRKKTCSNTFLDNFIGLLFFFITQFSFLHVKQEIDVSHKISLVNHFILPVRRVFSQFCQIFDAKITIKKCLNITHYLPFANLSFKVSWSSRSSAIASSVSVNDSSMICFTIKASSSQL